MLQKIFSFAVFASMVALSSCNDDDKISSLDIAAALKEGKWRVTSFIDSDKDETSNFTGFEFTFSISASSTSAGPVEGSNGTTSGIGSWSSVGSGDDTKLTISNFNIEPFNDLNEDWKVLEFTDTLIRLQHVSGGNGGTDLLTIERK